MSAPNLARTLAILRPFTLKRLEFSKNLDFPPFRVISPIEQESSRSPDLLAGRAALANRRPDGAARAVADNMCASFKTERTLHPINSGVSTVNRRYLSRT
jgi:hypothetical protein